MAWVLSLLALLTARPFPHTDWYMNLVALLVLMAATIFLLIFGLHALSYLRRR